MFLLGQSFQWFCCGDGGAVGVGVGVAGMVTMVTEDKHTYTHTQSL